MRIRPNTTTSSLVNEGALCNTVSVGNHSYSPCFVLVVDLLQVSGTWDDQMDPNCNVFYNTFLRPLHVSMVMRNMILKYYPDRF